MKVSAGGDWIGCLSALLRTPPRYKQAGETVRKEAGADQTTDIASSSAPSDGVADVFRIDFNSSFYMAAGSSNDYLLIFLSLYSDVSLSSQRKNGPSSQLIRCQTATPQSERKGTEKWFVIDQPPRSLNVSLSDK